MLKDELVLESLITSSETLIDTVVNQYSNIWNTAPGRANSQVLTGLSSLIKTTAELIKLKNELKDKKNINKDIKEFKEVKNKLELIEAISN